MKEAKAMNVVERANLVKAMELLVRSVNDERYMDFWLSQGVADGDLTPPPTTEDWDDEYGLGYYIQDDVFADLMASFLYIMHRAHKDGGLYCDRVVSNNLDEE